MLPFRLRSGSIGIQCGLPAVFFDPFFYHTVRDGKDSVHKRTEMFVFGTMFHYSPFISSQRWNEVENT
jgi:hypothetical protein